MGRATVVSSSGEGLYTIELDYGSEIIQAQIDSLQAQIDARQNELTEAEQALDEKQAEVDTLAAQLDAAINAFSGDRTEINRINRQLVQASAERNTAQARKSGIRAIINSLEADKRQAENVRTSETRQAWCVDYTEDATGEVATIEVPGEVGTLVIAPGGASPASNDGRLIARGAQQPHQVYFNAAILPGWQRFIHGYRNGALTGVDTSADTGTVNLDAATSSAAGLLVRNAETITAPIQYMTCNARAFEVGDRVIVDMSGPTIIGFESEPRQCENLRIFEIIIRRTYTGFDRNLYPATSNDSCAGDVAVQYWRDGVDFRTVVFEHEELQSCSFDLNATDYEGSCSVDSAAEWPEESLATLTGLGQANHEGTGVYMQGELLSPITRHDASVFSEIDLTYYAPGILNIFEVSSGYRACVTWDADEVVELGTARAAIEDIPNITRGSQVWEPVGFTRISEQADGFQGQVGGPTSSITWLKVRVLAKQIDD